MDMWRYNYINYLAPVPQGAELYDQPIGPSTASETASQPLDDFQNAFCDCPDVQPGAWNHYMRTSLQQMVMKL